MMMIKDEQEVTKSLDHSDTGQAHMKTWQKEWKNLLTQILDMMMMMTMMMMKILKKKDPSNVLFVTTSLKNWDGRLTKQSFETNVFSIFASGKHYLITCNFSPCVLLNHVCK